MAARSIASLTLSFGLVSIPVKLYSATESAASVRFNLLARDGSRVRQQYVSDKDPTQVVERGDLIKGYEFEKDRFVTFAPEELKALEEAASHSIDIVAFVPEKSVDPLYYDKAYLLAPDKRGGKPYALLSAALRQSGQCALARWSWKSKQYVVQVRAVQEGLVLQQLLYADEVRSLDDLHIEPAAVTDAELKLALQLIEQGSQPAYDPAQFEDEERKRILAAIDEKIQGRQIVAAGHAEAPQGGGQVIDLMEALRASLGQPGDARRRGESAGQAGRAADKRFAGQPESGQSAAGQQDAGRQNAAHDSPRAAGGSGRGAGRAQPKAAVATVEPIAALKERKGVKRARKSAGTEEAARPARARAGK